MREIKLKTGKRKTTIPRAKIKAAVEKVFSRKAAGEAKKPGIDKPAKTE